MNYYNEWDAATAAWLQELINQRLIPDGHVDTRSICDVQPGDLDGYTQCHFFAGIGGWSIALQLAGWPSDRPVFTGSCPCQPFSVIGKHEGKSDERHLWPELARLIKSGKPSVIFGEQVASKAGREWLDGVRIDLEGMGYAVGAADLCAAGVGSPTIRQRLYWMGVSSKQGLEGYSGDVQEGDKSRRHDAQSCGPITTASISIVDGSSMDAVPMLRGMDMHDTRGACTRLRLPTIGGMEYQSLRPWEQYDALPCADGWRRVQPGTFPVAHGVPARVVRLRGYGNAIIPQVAAEFIGAYMDFVVDNGG